MTDPLPRAVATMLSALNSKPEPERVRSFLDAVDDLTICRPCAAIAARKLTAYLGRRPLPRDLCLEAQDVMREDPEHDRHLTRRALSAGEGTAWWQSEGRAAVVAIWPDCPNPGWVADQLRRFGYVPSDRGAIATELGGPGSTERAWWLRHVEANVEVGA